MTEIPKPTEAEVQPVARENDEVEYVFDMGPNECYPDDHIDKPIEDCKISRRNVNFYNLMSQQSTKRYNVHFLDDDLIIYITGNKYQTYNLETKEIKTYSGQDTDGIGSIAVHHTRRFFAIAEKGVSPNIYIRQNPGYKIYRILRKGTEMMYAHVEFSSSGDKLVSLGGAPDYTLTVWDWRKERVVLKCKAFGQEVFRCSFSPYSDDVLFTGGSGHMKFWKMAQTFTGLKLQGEIAKYGQLELSDASGWQELPDGKIVSGTEYGTMVLWEGNLVKAHLVLSREDKTPLHTGGIETIFLIDESIVSCGTDGWIKWWSLAEIDAAEADEIAEIGIAPLREVLIATDSGDSAHILNVVRGKDIWLINDVKGRLWKVNIADFSAKVLFEYHSKEITGLAVSDAYNMAVTCGADGFVKVWDYLRGEVYYSQKFLGRANCVDIMRRSEMNKGRVIACGFETGILRVLQLTDSEIEIAMVMKAHDDPIEFALYSPNQLTLITASKSGEIFFFDVNGHLELGKCVPICLLILKNCIRINDIKWDTTSSRIIVACENGYVYEIERPDPANLDTSDSYHIADYPMRTWKMKMMEFQMKKNQKKDEEEEEKKRRARLRGELKNEDNEEEEDWDPEGITAVCYNEQNDPRNNFIVGSKGQYKGYYYLCNFESPRPLKAIATEQGLLLTQLSFNSSGEVLTMCFNNSEIRMLNLAFPERTLAIKQHDAHAGGITAAKLSFDERCLVSAGKDGILMIHAVDKYMLIQESMFNPLEGVAGIDFMPEAQVKEVYNERVAAFQEANPANVPEFDATVDGIDETIFSVSLRGFPDLVDDIVDTSCYSIQQAKLRTEEDHRMKLAEEKKQGVRRRVQKLREEFDELYNLNLKQEEVIRIGNEDFNIDPEYFEMLLERNASKIEETKKEVAWNIEYHTVRLDKLKAKFYDVLDFEKYTVKAMTTSAYVTTFRVPKMSEFLNRNIEQFRALIAQEVAAKENMEFDDEDDQGDQDANVDLKAVKKVEVKKAAVVSNQHKTDAEKKREERKIFREMRKKKIEKLLKKEMMVDSHGDIERNPQILEARATYGMYNLKMSNDYEVPENMQINFSKKRQQMVLLEGSIHKLKVDFNNKILDLKHKKTAIIQNITQMNTRISQINKVLEVQEELFVPVIDEKAEYPQKFFIINDKEIDEYRLLKVQREAEAAEKKKGGKKKNKQDQEEAVQQENKVEQVKETKRKPTHNNDNPYLNAVPARKGHKKMETELDEEYEQIMRIELQYEKTQLKQEADMMVSQFDAEIKEMQKEKYRLESDLKNAEIKLILLFEELIILKSMEAKDQELTQQLTSNRQEKGIIMKDITDITKKLKEKKKEIDTIKHEEEMLLVRFHEHCPEGSAKYTEIRKFYERITKKRRKVEKVDKEEQGEDDDDEEGEGEDQEEDEPEQEDEDEDPAISGLSQEDFKIDEIEKLRDERLQLYDNKEKIGLYITELEGNRRRMETQEKRINQELGETEEEIKDFQKEKMAKLNQLDVSVVLKIKQLQNLSTNGEKYAEWQKIRQQSVEAKIKAIQQDDNLQYEDKEQMVADLQKKFVNEEDWRGFYLPSDLTNSVLFTRSQLLQLIERKRELDVETALLKKEQVEDKQTESAKRKEINENKKIKAEKQREYNERQMLRFGNLVNLDDLEVSGPSQAVLDKQLEYQQTEKKCIRDIEEKEAEFRQIQRELTKCIQKNTDLLDMIYIEGIHTRDLNKKLDSINKTIFVNDDNADKQKKEHMKEHFRQKLEMQAKEIDILKTEINLYKRKGGHIYTKVTTNRRVAHLNNDN